MTALWAFTGEPDQILSDRMAAALVHRSRGRTARTDAAPAATIGVYAADSHTAGLAADPGSGATVAFSGRLPAGANLPDFVCAAGRLALDELAGEWILAVRTSRRLVIARDPAGARSVYWAEHGGRVLVGIEPKAVVAAPGFPRRVRPSAVAQFLAFSFIPGEACALADLHELPAGHRLDVDLHSGAARVNRWFIHEEEVSVEADPAAWVSPTRAAIDAAVTSRVPRDAPVSTFLSGGLDSSIVTTVAARACRQLGLPRPVSLSLHFGERYPNELPYARAVAAAAGTEHRIVEVPARDVEADLRRLVWHLDEPIGDPVTAGNFRLARAASEVSPWVLNGEGGDPVFAGPKNLPMLLAHWYRTDGDTSFRASRYLATWKRAAEEIQALVHPDLLAEIDLAEALDGVIEPFLGADRPAQFLNKLMVANMRLKGAHLILPKVERMLGAHGAVPLSPLFDPELIRLSLRMPPTAKLHNGIEKWVLKEAYRSVLPAAVVSRPKSGMRVPVRWWFRGELKPLARELLAPRAVRRAGIFRPERVKEIRRNRTGRDGLRLWMLVTFELWRRMVVEGESP